MAGPPPLPIGVILAGGRSRRFGGHDKSFAALEGRPLIAHVVSRTIPQVGELFINTSSADDRYRSFGLMLCRDLPRSIPATGPLVGVTSVFMELERRGEGNAALLSVPVDTPFLPADLARKLSHELVAADALVAYAATAERDHPVIALWGARSRDPARRLFDRQPNISLHAMMAALDAVRVVFPHDTRDPFLNINCMHDIETAKRICRSKDNR